MNKRELIKDFFSNLIIYLFIICAVISVQLIMGEGLPWRYLFSAVPFFGLYAARKFVFVVPTFFIIHGIFLALPFLFFSAWAERLPMAAGAVLCVIYSVRLRAKKEWRPDTRTAMQIMFCTAVMFVVTTVVLGVIAEDAERFFFGAAFISIAAMLLVIHMENVDRRMSFVEGRLKDMSPTRSVLSANNLLISGFLGFVMAVGMLTLVSPNVWRFMLWAVQGVFNGIAVVYMYLLTPFVLFVEREPAVYEEVVHYVAIPFQLNLLLDDYLDILFGDGNLGYADEAQMDAVVRFFYWHAAAAFIVLAIVLFFLARSVIRKLIKNFYNSTDGDENESLLPEDGKGRLRLMLGSAASLLPRLLAGIKNPVRRAFIKKVNYHIRKGVKITRSDTPAAIAEKIRPREDISTLAANYERVRYGR